MSTRMQLVIKSGKTEVWLYRHCDGYLAEAGADILLTLEDFLKQDTRYMSSAVKLASMFLSKTYDSGRPIYEETDCWHGDIEHYYGIDLDSEKEAQAWAISHSARTQGDWSTDVDKWVPANMRLCNLSKFREMVNNDRGAMNQRLAELRTQSSIYADSEDYGMV